MSKIYSQEITKFNGGTTDDVRTFTLDKGAFLENFDLGNNPQWLKPQIGLVQNSGSYSAAYNVRKILVGSDNNVWGLGLKSATSLGKVYKLTATGSGLINSSANWTAPANGESSNNVNYVLWTEYKDYIWSFGGTTKLDKYGPLSSSPTFTSDVDAFAQSVVVSGDGFIGVDDNLYIPYHWTDKTLTGVARWDNVNLQEAVITIPPEYIITQLCPYGNYMAIIAKPRRIDGSSKLFLWDFVSEDVSEQIDLGPGMALGGDYLEGSVVVFINEDGVGSITRPYFLRVVSWSGGVPDNLFKIQGGTLYVTGDGTVRSRIQTTTPAYAYRGNIYIGCNLTLENNTVTSFTARAGILRVGRKDAANPVSYSFDFSVADLSTIADPPLGIKDFLFYKQNFLAMNDVGTSNQTDAWVSSVTDTWSNFTYAYQSQIFNGGDASLRKNLYGVAVDYIPLTTGQSVVMKYKVNGETVYTTIFTDTTVGATSHEATTVEGTSNSLPHFQEIQFKIESVGGAEITGYRFLYTIEASKLGLN